MIDTDKLVQIMAEKGLSRRKVADHLGISAKTLYRKLKKGVFDSDEMEQLAILLTIPDPASIFFATCGTQNAPKPIHNEKGRGSRFRPDA